MKSSRYALLLLLLPFMACEQSIEVDLIVHNANIYTVDQDFSKAEAMAIQDGKVLAIGAENEIRNKYNSSNTLDAKLQTIYPGWIDAHCHFMPYGFTFQEVQLVGTESWYEVVEMVKEFAANSQREWITGWGWDQSDWAIATFPDRYLLDSLFPDRPVLLKRIDGHAAIANGKALELAGITVNSPIQGGVYEQKEGRLTGMLIDNAVDSVRKAIPELTEEERRYSLLKAQENCFAKGLTTVSDALMEAEVLKSIDRLQQSGELKMKVYAMLVPSDANKERFLQEGPYKTDRLNVRAFKYIVDGAMGSRGAHLRDPYSDDLHNTGLLLNDSAYFQKEAEALYAKGFQMNSHCIGDAANRLMLSIYANVLGGTNDRRWRIEHAQLMAAEDFDYFKNFNIIPSVQPTHATSDMYWLEARLGKERMPNAYAYRRLMEQNGLIALGTDFPIEDIDPLKTFFAAVYRQDIQYFPEEGFQMEDALTPEETLKGMTIWAAMANFEENEKGSLEIGKAADFIITDRDILKVKKEEVLGTKVVKTFVNGEKVFDVTD